MTSPFAVAFSWIFLAVLAAATATRLWLALRQVRHVRAHRGAVPATFAEAIPLAAHQKAADYTVAKARLGMIDIALDAVVLLALTLGGRLQWLSGAVGARASRPARIAHGTALILSVVLPAVAARAAARAVPHLRRRAALRLQPHDAAAVRHRPGQARRWSALALGVPLLLAVLWLMERMGRWWWLYVWVVWIAFSLVLMMIYPAFILPLFNKFTPLPDGELAARVERLLARTGFRSRGLYVMDGSKRSSARQRLLRRLRRGASASCCSTRW